MDDSDTSVIEPSSSTSPKTTPEPGPSKQKSVSDTVNSTDNSSISIDSPNSSNSSSLSSKLDAIATNISEEISGNKNPLRYEVDPLADATIAKIIAAEASDQPLKRPFLIRFDDLSRLKPESRAVLKEYQQKTAELPAWADERKMNRGAQVFGAYGAQIVLSLFCAALPTCYACADGAQVLFSTKRLRQNTEDFSIYNHRIMETAQFILNVMQPNGFKGDQEALKTIQQIRLIHASIRYYLASDDWDSENLGKPINQQDQTGTLLTFSYLALVSLRKMGVMLSNREKDDYLHLWNVVGYVSGVKEELLKHSYEETEELFNEIIEEQTAESEAGRVLTKALLDYINQVLLKNNLCDVAVIIMRDLIGDEKANLLGVPHKYNIVVNILLFLARIGFWFLSTFFRRNPLAKFISAWFGRRFLQLLVIHYNDNHDIEFNVPAHLTPMIGDLPKKK